MCRRRRTSLPSPRGTLAAPRPPFQARGRPPGAGTTLRARGSLERTHRWQGRGPPLKAHGPPSGHPGPPLQLGNRPPDTRTAPGAGTAPPAQEPPHQARGQPPASRPTLQPRPLAPLALTPPRHGQLRPSALPHPTPYESGLLRRQPSSELRWAGLSSPAGLPESDRGLSRNICCPLLVAPGVPFVWCLIGMLLVVLVLLLPTISVSLQSVRAGGEPEQLQEPADRAQGSWDEVAFSLVRVVGLGPSGVIRNWSRKRRQGDHIALEEPSCLLVRTQRCRGNAHFSLDLPRGKLGH